MKPMKILIVEDDPLAAAFLCQGLIESNWDFHHFFFNYFNFFIFWCFGK